MHSFQEAELDLAYSHLKVGALALAGQLFLQILAECPTQAYALNGLGCCAEFKGHLKQAEDYYRQALSLMPHEQEFLSNLAICLQQLRRSSEAIEILYTLCQHHPSVDSYYNLALAQFQNRQPWDALESIRQIFDLNPEYSGAILLLFDLMEFLLSQPDSYVHLKQLSAQSPEDGLYQIALGIYYEFQGEDKIAARYYRSVLQRNPGILEVYQLLIQSLQAQGDYAQALNIARGLIMQNTLNPFSILGLVMTLQEPISASQKAALQLHHELERVLNEYKDALLGLKMLPRAINIPFYTVYQQGKDRLIQEKMAHFFMPLAKKLVPQAVRHQRPRLGIVSVHLYQHSVTDLLVRALLVLLKSQDFETYLFYANKPPKEDALTDQLRQAADHFIYVSDKTDHAAAMISALSLDILIYPDVGMEVSTYLLALHRLARHQMVLPGHPVTTGMSTMDYFISGEVLETSQSDELFSENLVRLAGLPDYEKPVRPVYVSASELGLPQGRLYFCPMTIFKLQPGFDAVLDAILRADSEAQILLLAYKNDLHLKLKRRLQHTVLDAERIHFLPWSHKEIFYQRLMAVDVILDSFYFGGGNTAYQAFGLGCPIVTLDQPWNKGRWTQAMYKMMGVEGLIAKDTQEYVHIALRLAQDKTWQMQKRAEIQSKNQVLFDNPTWSHSLLDFCKTLT